MADEKDLYSVNENTGKTKNGLIIEYTGSNEQIKQSAGNQAAIKASKVMDEEAKKPLPKFTLSDGKVSVTGGKDNLSHPVVTEIKKALSDAFKGKDLTDKDVAAAFQKAISKANEQIDAQFKYEDYENFLKSSGFSDDAYRSYSTARQEFKKTNPTSSTAMVTTYDKDGKLVSKSIAEWFDYWKKEYSPEDRGQLWVKSLQASYNPTSDEDLYASIPAILMGTNKGQNWVQGFFQWINPFDDKGAEAPTVSPVYGFDDTNPISVGVQSAVTEFGRILPQFFGAGENPWSWAGAENGKEFFGIDDWDDKYFVDLSREDYQDLVETAYDAVKNGYDSYEKMRDEYGAETARKMWTAYTFATRNQGGAGNGRMLSEIKDRDGTVIAEPGDYPGYMAYRDMYLDLNNKTPAKAWDQNLQRSIEKFATYAPNAASVGVVAGQVGRIIAEQAALSLISGGALSASNIAKTLTQGGWKLVGKATGIIKTGQEIAKTSPALARAIYGLAYSSSQGLTGASRILYRLGQAGTWAVREVGEDALRGIVDDVVTGNSFDSQGNLDRTKFLENVYMNAVMGAILKGPRTVSDVAMYLLNADRNIDGLKLNGTQVSQMQDLAQAVSGTADSVVKSIDEDGHPTITKGGVDQKLDQVTLTKENADKVLPEQAPTKTLEEAVFEDESIAKKTQGDTGEVSIADEEVKEVISGQDPEAAKNLIERKLTDDEIRRKFKNGKVSINGEDYIIDVKNANLDDIVSANGSTIKDLNTGVARLVEAAKQGLRSYQEAVNGIKNHADEFATNWKNAVEKFASDNNISVRDVIIALRDLRIDGKESYPGLKALWEENWAPFANSLLDAQDSLTKIRTKRQNYYQRDMFAGVFKPGENGSYAIDQGTIDDILGRDTTFDLTASSRKGNRQKVNDADLETDPEILAKEFVLSRLETIERYSDQGKIITTMREAISDGEELAQKEAAESLRASKKIGDDIRNSEEVKAIGETVTEEAPADNIEKLPETFGKEDMAKLNEDIEAQKKVVSDLEAEAASRAKLDDEIKSQRAQVARSQEEVDRLKAKETDPKAVSKLNYDARKELAEKVARNNQRADGYGSKYTVLYRVQGGKPDKWRPNNRNTGFPGEFKSYGGQWDGAVWLTADKEWAENPKSRASAGVNTEFNGGRGENVTNENIVVIPVKNEDILFLNHETGSKAALDESGKKIVKTRGINNGMKKSEFILWENEHPEIFEDGHKAMLEELNKQREFENKRALRRAEDTLASDKKLLSELEAQVKGAENAQAIKPVSEEPVAQEKVDISWYNSNHPVEDGKIDDPSQRVIPKISEAGEDIRGANRPDGYGTPEYFNKSSDDYTEEDWKYSARESLKRYEELVAQRSELEKNGWKDDIGRNFTEREPIVNKDGDVVGYGASGAENLDLRITTEYKNYQDALSHLRGGEPTTAIIDAYNEEAKFSAFRSKDVAAPSKKAGYKFVEDNTPIEGVKNENGSLTRWLAGSSDESDFKNRIAQVPKEIRDIADSDSNFKRLVENYQEDVAYKRVGTDYPYSADRIDMSYANYLDAEKQTSASMREARINNELAAERQKLADLEERKAAIEKIEKAGDPNTEAGQKAREKTTVEVVADTAKNTAERAQDNFNKAADKSNAAREISESSKYRNRASAQANQNPIGVNYMPGNPYRGFGRWINDDFMRSQSVQINVNGKVYSAYSGGYSLFKEAPSWARMAIIDIRNGATLETAIRNVLSQNGVKIEPTDYARQKYNAPTSMEKDAEKASRIAKKITESALYGKAVKNGIVVDTELLGSMLTKELRRQGAAEFTRFLKKSKFDSFSNPQQKWLNSQAYKMIASFDPKTYKGIKARIRKAMGVVMGAKYRSNMYGNFKNAQLQLTECQRLYTLNKLGDFNKTIRRLVTDQAFRDKIADAAYIYASDSLGQGLSKQDLSLFNQTLESFMKTADASTITAKGILTKLSEGAKKGTKAAIDGVDADLLSATQAAEYFKNYMLLAGIVQSAETKGLTGEAANAYIRNRFNVEALAGTEIGHIGLTESSIGRLAFMYMGFPIRELALQAHIIKGGGTTGGTTKLDKVAGGLLYAEKMLGAKGLVWALEAPWGYKFADVMGYDPFGVTDDRDKTADNENVDPWMRGADIAIQYMPFMRGAISSAFVDIYMAYRESYEDAKDEWLETHDSLEGFEWHLDDAPQDTIWQDALKGFTPGYTAFSRAAQEAGDLDRGYGISSTGNRMYETNTDPGSVAWGMLVGRSNTPNAMDYYQTANPIGDVQRYGLSGLGRSVERALPFRLNRSEGAQMGWRNFREFDPIDANSYSDWFDGSYADEQNWNTGYYAFREEAEEIRDAANSGLNQSNAVEKLASRESQLADLRNRVERYVQAYIAQHPEGISNYKMQQIQRIFNMEIPDAGTSFDRVLGDYSDYEKNYAENRVAQGNFPAPYGLNTPYRTQDGTVAGDYSYAQSPQLRNILQTNQYGVQSDVGRVIAQLDDQLVATPYGSMSLKDFRKKIQADINNEYAQSKVNYNKISDLQSQYLDVFDRSIRPIFSTYGSGILDAGQASDVMQQFTSMLNGLIPSEEYRVDKKGRKIRQSTPYMRVDIKKWLQKNYGNYPAVSTTDNSSEERLQGIRNDMDAGRTAVARAKALAFIEDLREGRTSIDRTRLEELQNILRGTTGSGVTGGGNLNTGLTR